MSAAAWVIVAVVAVIVVVVVASVVVGTRRRRQLKDLFGPEYERTVDAAGGRRHGEAELRQREQDRRHLDIRPLSASARDGYRAEWERVQAGFVDRPALALHEADALVTSVMMERGYPAESFEQQAALASVDHAATVERYREAHSVHLRADSSETTTDELRSAFVEYRSLFDELVRDGHDGAPVEGDDHVRH